MITKWWLTAHHGQDKAASEWLCNEPLLIQSHAFFDPVKKAKVKAVNKVRNKDLVLPLVLGLHFWDSSGKPRTKPTVSMKRQATEVVDLLWSYVPCGRLE